MSLALSPFTQQRIAAYVADRGYADPEHVVNTALDALDETVGSEVQLDIEWLRREIEIGMKDVREGRVSDGFDAMEILARIQARRASSS